MNFKKLTLFFAILAVMFALAACGGGDEGGGGDTGQETTAAQEASAKTQEDTQEQAAVPRDKNLTLSIPKMGRVNGAVIPTARGNDDQQLKTHAAIHLKGTGFPWDKEANVYIAGHRLGYPDTQSFLAFYDLDKLQDGDEIYVTDANGQQYTYKVFEERVVEPTDVHVTDPIKGKNILSLQSCTLPDYTKRLIVRAELVEA